MVVCGRLWIPVKVEEVFLDEQGQATQLNSENIYCVNRSIVLRCGEKNSFFDTSTRYTKYGHIICRDCALKAGFIW